MQTVFRYTFYQSLIFNHRSLIGQINYEISIQPFKRNKGYLIFTIFQLGLFPTFEKFAYFPFHAF